MLLLLTLCGFAANLGGRYFDPLVTAIARDFLAPTTMVALLSSAFTLPFGLGQPILGPLGDALGKPAVFKVCFWVLAVALVASVLATDLSFLFATRIVAGLAAGGLIPLGLAMLGDMTAASERQVAFARFALGALIGQIIGLTAAGALADAIGWRYALILPAALAILAAIAASLRLPSAQTAPREPLRLGSALARYGLVFRNPQTPICYVTVFLEGIVVYGSLPFVVELLEQSHRGGPREAGLVVSGIGLGCILMSFLIRPAVRWLKPDGMMRCGGLIAAAGFVGVAFGTQWWTEAVYFTVVGFGFFMIHNPLQNRVMELAPTARGSAVAFHYFSFFMGQAVAPLIFGFLLAHFGATGSYLVNAAVIGLTGILCVTALRATERA
ncbi:MAG: MFS transporter [Variibacter sp.]